ncbi:MAG: hypothetical protein MJE66_00820 [Proteobacteria bacterium]|nr:hypothetical protein [Pseudomonadota bacterium]
MTVRTSDLTTGPEAPDPETGPEDGYEFTGCLDYTAYLLELHVRPRDRYLPLGPYDETT